MLTGKHKKTLLVAALAAGFLALGCRQDMHNQPKIEPLEENFFFADGMGARPTPAGTVARGQLKADTHLHTGQDAAGEFIDTLPPSILLDRALLERGQNRYGIYCTPCHDQAGSGRGMIVRRGFKQPPAFYEQRLRAMPLGYFYDVMTRGFGVMSSYAKQVPVEDRWAIAAYIRVLQASQAMTVDELGPLRADFDAALAAAAATTDAATADAATTDAHGEEMKHE